MKKMLVTVGDSWMCPDIRHPNTHFSEIISQKLNYDLLVYAREGMSNGGICIQIESAIKLKPDLILVGLTTTDRLEWPINDKPITEFSVENIVYKHKNSVSSHVSYVSQDPILVSTNIYELDNPRFYENNFSFDNYAKERQESLKHYLSYLYHSDWKKQIDRWCLYAVLHKLELSGISYMIVFNFSESGERQWILENCSWLNESTYMVDYNIFNPNQMLLPSYHTDYKQQEIIAESILKNIP
jgi:hypothetical protein